MLKVKLKIFLKNPGSASLEITEKAVIANKTPGEIKLGDTVEYEDPFISGHERKGRINNLDHFFDEGLLYIVINVLNT